MDATSLMINAGVGLLVILSAYLAMVRGFIREMLALVSWIIAFFTAIYVGPMLKEPIGALPVVGDFLKNCQVLSFVALVVVFGLTLIALGLLYYMLSGPSRTRRGGADGGPVFSGAGRNTRASILDQGLGFIYGALRGLVLVAVIYIAYVTVSPEKTLASGSAAVAGEATTGQTAPEAPQLPRGQHDIVRDAGATKFVRPVAEFIWKQTPEEMPTWLAQQAEALLGDCSN